jgi:hypothetical protein
MSKYSKLLNQRFEKISKIFNIDYFQTIFKQEETLLESFEYILAFLNIQIDKDFLFINEIFRYIFLTFLSSKFEKKKLKISEIQNWKHLLIE